MAWTDLARVKRFLALAESDTADDAVITDAIEAAQHLAITTRASSGYVGDDPNTPPNAGAREAVTRWAALLYQARGTGEGFAGFIDTGATIGTPYYESRRTILLLLGVPRVTVDGDQDDETPSPGWEYVRYQPDGSVDLAAAPSVSVPQGTDPEHAARLSDVTTPPPAELPPFYYAKAAGILDVGETYEPIVALTTPDDTPAGVYMFGLSISYVWPTTSRSVYIRWRERNGDWNEFVHEPGDATDVVPLVYTYPTTWNGGAFAFDLEMHKESGGGANQLDVSYADVWAQRVA